MERSSGACADADIDPQRSAATAKDVIQRSISNPPYGGFAQQMETDNILPSLVKEGSREAAGGLFKKMNPLITTTPALRATPPHLRRGVLSVHPICWAKLPLGEGGAKRRVRVASLPNP
jgi:hypothetical protein